MNKIHYLIDRSKLIFNENIFKNQNKQLIFPHDLFQSTIESGKVHKDKIIRYLEKS